MMRDTAADMIADNLQTAVSERGQASLVVSGGSSPLPLCRPVPEGAALGTNHHHACG